MRLKANKTKMFSILSSEMVLEKPWLLGISNKSCFQIATRELIMVSFLIFAILSIFCNPFFFFCCSKRAWQISVEGPYLRRCNFSHLFCCSLQRFQAGVYGPLICQYLKILQSKLEMHHKVITRKNNA